jgi:AmmeMemoRadiSam system protein B
MIQRFLFNGVDTEAAGATVGIEFDLAALDAAHETEATLAFVHAAFTRADVALNAAVLESVPVLSGMNFHLSTGVYVTMNARIRPAAVAGLFYPGQPAELRDAVSDYFAQAPAAVGAPPKALIVPHAGYIYSGGIAAAAYSQLAHRRSQIRRVVLIGPSHRVYLEGMAVPAAEAFQTPLGVVPIDAELKARALAHSHVVEADEPHANEHCLEVQLPFLQMLLDEFTLLPVTLGLVSPSAVANLLAEAWGGEETLVLVSSDLSHYLPYDAARKLDAVTIAAILRYDTHLTGEQACGCIGINGLSYLAQQRRLSIAEIARCNSGDTAGDRYRVVGYGAFRLHEPAIHQ